jgi:hypothetical protein
MSRSPAPVEAREVTLLDLVDRAVDYGVTVERAARRIGT